ncbi:MAG: fluoride efflux transporter CrcB [Gemmatimonadota bacterium]|nr:fluoride efflux transporter CrcB [Gemmatimonadota bacterium]
MLQVLLIGCGGFIGTIARYGVATMAYRLLGASFPYGTLTVNILGCLLIGFVSIAAEERDMIARSTRLFLTIGILGGFTTFSSFGYETLTLLRLGNIFPAALYVFASVVTGLAAVWLGGVLARVV